VIQSDEDSNLECCRLMLPGVADGKYMVQPTVSERTAVIRSTGIPRNAAARTCSFRGPTIAN
jgi:hypothetical protein